MEKNYRKIEFYAGDTIDMAIKHMKRFKDRGEFVYGEFNGQNLYSDIDDLDSAYKKITGKTKSEFLEEERIANEEYQEKKRRHVESIPDLTEEWIEKGESILDKKYHQIWKECVPIRLSDLYRGMELGACLDIVKELNSGCGLETAKKIIEDQNHSGMSFSLVCSMVVAFCDRGSEFVDYVR